MAAYGTNFEALEDEANTAVGKRPTRVHEEVVTDEKGRRRFHGAFTGGFSAGYFNTVGSKHGWVPQTFKSSRADRPDNDAQTAEDFMDDDDLGEYGIAPRRVRAKADFNDFTAATTDDSGPREVLAWERSTADAPTASTSSGFNLFEGSSALADLVKPVSDSYGVRLMRRMGWRQGKGVGANKTRAVDKEGGTSSFSFQPDDTVLTTLTPNDGLRGIDYLGLVGTSSTAARPTVLDETYGQKSTGYKERRGAKPIRGQAFGVGAFEDADEDVYTFTDIAQYDFAIGDGVRVREPKLAHLDSTFEPAPVICEASARKKFPPPKIPRDFKPKAVTRPPPPLVERRSVKSVRERAEKLHDTATDGTLSVMMYLKEADRKRLGKLLEAKLDKEEAEKGERDGRRDGERRRRSPESKPKVEPKVEAMSTKAFVAQSTTEPTELPFASDASKMRAFERYVDHVRRGVTAAQPHTMTEWEWDADVKLFEAHLPADVRQERVTSKETGPRGQMPLAPAHIATPFAHLLSSKFTSSKLADTKAGANDGSDSDLIQAVRMGMFGHVTRQTLDWHPHTMLCLRFNVPDPYEGSDTVGIANVATKKTTLLAVGPKKSSASSTASMLGMSALPSTALEMENRQRMERRRREDEEHRRRAEDAKKEEEMKPSVSESAPLVRPPIDLFRAVFADEQADDVDESDSSDDEPEPSAAPLPHAVVDVDNAGLRRTLGRLVGEEAMRPINMADEVKPPITVVPPAQSKAQLLLLEQQAARRAMENQIAPKVEGGGSFGPALPPPIGDVTPKVEPMVIDDTDDLAVVFEHRRHHGDADRSHKKAKKNKKEKKEKKHKSKDIHKSKKSSKRVDEVITL